MRWFSTKWEVDGEGRRAGSWCSALVVLMVGVASSMLVTGCFYDWPVSAIPTDGSVDGGEGGDAGDAGDAGAVCGNGRLEASESCDGSQLGGETCASRGYGGGILACTSGCAFDTSGCVTEEVCGDGFVGSNEECDDGDLASGDGCDGTCVVEPGWACKGEPSVCTDGCGNGVCYGPAGEDPTSCAADCGWIQVAAGAAHTCGVKADGTAWCWGDNSAGQLGDGTTESSASPVQVEDLAGVTQIAAGEAHTCAIAAAGAVYCWGANGDGQLGDGTIMSSADPVQAGSLFDAMRLAAGGAHTCAVTAAHEAWCWGDNSDGQLGDGTPVNRQDPTPVSVGAGLTSAQDVAAGGAHTCAIHTDGSLWCWGANDSGQLGTGDTQNSLLPLAVDTSSGLGSATLIVAGDTHTCAREDSGDAWCWGNGDQRRLGDGGSQSRSSPVAVIDVGSVLALAAGEAHSCAVASDGVPWCWGDGGNGRLGIGSSPPQSNPRPLAAPTDAIQVVAGARHACALDGAGRLWCWGDGAAGQLGTGDTTTQRSAVAVQDPY